jgi:hypothetical protein
MLIVSRESRAIAAWRRGSEGGRGKKANWEMKVLALGRTYRS